MPVEPNTFYTSSDDTLSLSQLVINHSAIVIKQPGWLNAAQVLRVQQLARQHQTDIQTEVMLPLMSKTHSLDIGFVPAKLHWQQIMLQQLRWIISQPPATPLIRVLVYQALHQCLPCFMASKIDLDALSRFELVGTITAPERLHFYLSDAVITLHYSPLNAFPQKAAFVSLTQWHAHLTALQQLAIRLAPDGANNSANGTVQHA